MPLIILAIRIEVELIFKNTYKLFFSKEHHEKIAIKLINDIITAIVDPNLYYSRFSFFESGRDAIDIKLQKSKKGHQTNTKAKFMTRSTLMEQLIPNPSEGEVRAKFGTGKISYPTYKAKSSAPKRSVMESE